MLFNQNNFLEKKKTFIFIFIQKIAAKNMQDLIFFVQKNNFNLKRINKKNNKQDFTSIFVNSNFILESQQNIRSTQLENFLQFLNQHAQINGIFFNNQILNLDRMHKLEKQSSLMLWKQIKNLTL